jgi:FkbH-like protein
MSNHDQAAAIAEEVKAQSVKCVVWDLDNTVWDGILLEDSAVRLRPEVVEVIKTLDRRGILNSIASRNDHETAVAKLEEFGILEYFLYPQINWNSKADSIQQIAKLINIGLDTFAFVDDQPFEREEVAYVLPQVLCIDALEAERMTEMKRLNPRFITEDSAMRRKMYQSDIARKEAEEQFVGPNEEFLATLGLVFTVAEAQEDDLQRAEELTQRTNQLNTTGYTYSYDELNQFRLSPDHLLLVSTLEDKYGTYGKIGLALVECGAEVWTLKLLLMSCRVMSRGVGGVMMSYIMRRAKQAGAKLQAEFVTTSRNRMMYITYKFGGFQEVKRDGNRILFEHDLAAIAEFPAYVEVHLPQA